MPVIDVRVPGANERELRQVSIPATNAGIVAQLADLANIGTGAKYIGALVVNAASDFVTVLDNAGRSFVVQAGQPFDADFEPGVTWLGIMPNSNITAGQVSVVPRIREPI